MSDKIQTRIFNHGDKKESKWPSQYGTLERGIFYISESGELTAGYPPSKVQRFGTAPAFIGDDMPSTLNHADNKYYTSKSKFRASTKAHGFIEVGNEKIKPAKRREPDLKAIEASVAKAYNEIEHGMARLTEKDRAVCKIADRQLKEKHDIE